MGAGLRQESERDGVDLSGWERGRDGSAWVLGERVRRRRRAFRAGREREREMVGRGD